MNCIGQKETLTQRQVIRFFHNQLGYDFLGNWKNREASHCVQGRRYRLSIIEEDAPASITIRNGRTPELRVRPGTEEEKRREVLQRWYRQLLRDQIPDLLAKWEPIVGVEVAHCGIKRPTFPV